MSTDIQHIESTQVRLTNTSVDALPFWLEPWGRLYSVPPRSSVDVLFEAAEAGVPEVIHESHCIVVYAWPGAEVRVTQDGHELEQVDQRRQP